MLKLNIFRSGRLLPTILWVLAIAIVIWVTVAVCKHYYVARTGLAWPGDPTIAVKDGTLTQAESNRLRVLEFLERMGFSISDRDIKWQVSIDYTRPPRDTGDNRHWRRFMGMLYLPFYKQMTPKSREFVFETARSRLINCPPADQWYALQALGHLGDPRAIPLIKKIKKRAAPGSDSAIVASWALYRISERTK